MVKDSDFVAAWKSILLSTDTTPTRYVEELQVGFVYRSTVFSSLVIKYLAYVFLAHGWKTLGFGKVVSFFVY